VTAALTGVPGIAGPPQSLERFAILDEKSWDIMGYYGRQWNDPAPAPSFGRRRIKAFEPH